MSGKGSAPRPFSVDNETFKRNFDAIFGKTNEQFNQDSSGSKCSVAEAGACCGANCKAKEKEASSGMEKSECSRA